MRFTDAAIWFVSGFLTGLRAFRRRLWGKPYQPQRDDPTLLQLPAARRAQLAEAIRTTQQRSAA